MSPPLSGMGVRRAAWAASGFDPNILGRIDANGFVVEADGSDEDIDPGSASCDTEAGIWVIQTATEAFVRCGCEVVVANTLSLERWFDTGGTSQGDPGIISSAGATIFELGTTCDSVRINRTTNSISGTPVFAQIGSYTNNSFFTPTQDVKYGGRVDSLAQQSGFGISNETGETTLAITFRKTGESDYTVTFRARADSRAFVEI